MLSEEEKAKRVLYYGSTIDAVRQLLSKQHVVEEQTYKYAQTRIFARMTLSMCEILVLADNSYPNGAFSLSRQSLLMSLDSYICSIISIPITSFVLNLRIIVRPFPIKLTLFFTDPPRTFSSL